MESSHNAPIIHAFYLAQKRFFSTSKPRAEWGTWVHVAHSDNVLHFDMYPIQTILHQFSVLRQGIRVFAQNNFCLFDNLSIRPLETTDFRNRVHVEMGYMYPIQYEVF